MQERADVQQRKLPQESTTFMTRYNLPIFLQYNNNLENNTKFHIT